MSLDQDINNSEHLCSEWDLVPGVSEGQVCSVPVVSGGPEMRGLLWFDQSESCGYHLSVRADHNTPHSSWLGHF